MYEKNVSHTSEILKHKRHLSIKLLNLHINILVMDILATNMNGLKCNVYILMNGSGADYMGFISGLWIMRNPRK